MRAITGYTELMNYRNLLMGGTTGNSGNAETAVEKADEAPRQPAENPEHRSGNESPVSDTAERAFYGRSDSDVLPNIRSILESIKQAGGSLTDDDLQDTLDDMVISGHITDDQADEIYAGLKQARASMPSAAVMRNLNNLMDAGVLTAEQRDAAAEVLSGSNEGLQDLVDDGTITQDQMDSVLASCHSVVKLRQARQAYSLMQYNPMAMVASVMAEGRQSTMLDAYDESMAEGVSA